MTHRLVSLLPGESTPPRWEIGWARGVERAALREHLGQPLYVEADSRCTFGGEEDWWAYKIPGGHVIAVCLRVPYQDAVLCTSRRAGDGMEHARTLLKPWSFEPFAEPRLR
jgi:hypothetical protein